MNLRNKLAIFGLCVIFNPGWAEVISATPTKDLAPPPTRVDPVTDDYFGTKVVDPYRWLEGGTPELDKEVAEWTKAQNAYTRRYLDSLPNRDKLADRLRELLEVGSIGIPAMRGDRVFYTRREGDQNQPVLYVRRSDEDAPRVLIDPNTLDSEGLVSLDWYAPSPDGSLLAFGISRAGSENSTLHIMDVDSGKWYADEIPNRAGGVQWFPDMKGFLYDALADPQNPYSDEVRYHELGESPSRDKIIWKQFSETWGPWVMLSHDGRWMLAGYWTGTDSNDLWVVDADRWRRTGEFNRVPIAVGIKGAKFSGPIYGDRLYLLTTHEHPNGIVYGVDLNNPDRKNWKVIIPERDNAVLKDISMARGMIIATYMENVSTRIERFDPEGKFIGQVTLPGIGSARISTNPDRREAYYSFVSFNQPTTIYRTDLNKDQSSKWAQLNVPVNPDLVEVNLVHYPSKDGQKISMFVIHRKGLKLTGRNPTLLYGYGGFDVSITPFFWSTKFPFFEAGGVVAIPHLRGGGEYGAKWHQAGMLENKQNTFDDFIAAAEWLQKQKYTDPDHLAVYGGSNGGLLIGAFITQRPDLCTAAICSVPLLDMLRYQKFLMAKYWVPEYGSSEDKKQFRYIYAYSPYQHVKKGVHYPATFLLAGENDSRVHPMHARKMAAALQTATSGDPAVDPILLWVDQEAGHGQGKPFSLRLRDSVDFHAFLYWQLGITPP